jgi:hypothetical protein
VQHNHIAMYPIKHQQDAAGQGFMRTCHRVCTGRIRPEPSVRLFPRGLSLLPVLMK